ncbi:hypothetical protein LCGC14_0195330 [marine sediment metagenome]|uniref:Uncharacterized protein n=1 Tax=marine sediment metagenome TaxID=412755 RepID=A0A0F9UKB3_9ZZZZ
MKLVLITESYEEKQWMMGRVGELVPNDGEGLMGISPKIRVPDGDGKDHFIYGYESWWSGLPDIPDIPDDIQPGDSIPAYVFKELYRSTQQTKALMDEIAIEGGHLSAADALKEIGERLLWTERIADTVRIFFSNMLDKITPSKEKLDKLSPEEKQKEMLIAENKMKEALEPHKEYIKEVMAIQEQEQVATEDDYNRVKEILDNIVFD